MGSSLYPREINYKDLTDEQKLALDQANEMLKLSPTDAIEEQIRSLLSTATGTNVQCWDFLDLIENVYSLSEDQQRNVVIEIIYESN